MFLPLIIFHPYLYLYSTKNSSIFTLSSLFSSEVDSRSRPVVAKIDMEQINTIDLGNYDSIFILYAFPPIDKYVQILTGMARHTVNGVLHTFITKEEASFAGSLVELLEECGQAVPETVRNSSLT